MPSSLPAYMQPDGHDVDGNFGVFELVADVPWHQGYAAEGAARGLTLSMVIAMSAADRASIELDLVADERLRVASIAVSASAQSSIRRIEAAELQILDTSLETVRTGPGELYVDVRANGRLVVRCPSGQRLIIGGDTQRWGCALESVNVGATASAPIALWVRVAADPFFERELGNDIGNTSTDAVARAAGLLRRYAADWSRENRDRELAEFRAGRLPARLQAIEDWARTLPPAQQRWLESAAAVTVKRLSDTMNSMADDPYPDAGDWITRCEQLCVGRDDLENILWVLRTASGSVPETLSATVAALDRSGESFVNELPVSVAFERERLRRLALVDPHVWWAALSDAHPHGMIW